ncbi:SUKH-3 domain-containing protein [Deinococcus roseus]|uniref:Uncharacterized protein n=1 Tax=Deinococcus roseus TaxID=392414 RepID=A0ABQ2DAB4_9DEIO|nr:SUKH-3 domain-containing protein [Deinococcus roseus]GGJ47550.1 hypothetical protein GCM10008938_36930 [Deinococcus roseus]
MKTELSEKSALFLQMSQQHKWDDNRRESIMLSLREEGIVNSESAEAYLSLYGGLIFTLAETEPDILNNLTKIASSFDEVMMHHDDIQIFVFDYLLDDDRDDRPLRTRKFSGVLGKQVSMIGYIIDRGYFFDVLVDEDGIVYKGDFDHQVISCHGDDLNDMINRAVNNEGVTERISTPIVFDIVEDEWIRVDEIEVERRRRLYTGDIE